MSYSISNTPMMQSPRDAYMATFDDIEWMAMADSNTPYVADYTRAADTTTSNNSDMYNNMVYNESVHRTEQQQQIPSSLYNTSSNTHASNNTLETYNAALNPAYAQYINSTS